MSPVGAAGAASPASAASPAGTVGHLGIDVGGTKVALRLVPVGGAPREASFRWSAGVPAETDLRDLGAGVAALLGEWDGRLAGVGVAMPATVDPSGRVTAWPSRPSWTGLDLGQAVRELATGAPVALGDDGDLAALAEADHAGSANLVYVGVGTGIGGGIVLDGRLCPGTARGSCEIGHLIVALDGPRCRCGRDGCLQALASGPATLRRATELRATARPGASDEPAAAAEVTYPELREAWVEGAGWARAAVGTTARAIAGTLVGLTELVRPDLAVVGGGFADGLPGLVDAITVQAQAMARPGHPPVPVRAAALGGLSSLAGAVILARHADEGRGDGRDLDRERRADHLGLGLDPARSVLRTG
ncbi:ROK family protein [Parafrankia sp. EAN1pec]|uniref:ROK family protein n=1 Tax=Parafrankia sp. (strain EAN1pec) TaxID=298653 RepID=UPI00015D9D36|nr:ROK family protein [Frankia sp. EAN1pec]